MMANGQMFDVLLDAIDIDTHLMPFLDLSGWHHVDPQNERWWVWNGAADIDGEPLELVFPRQGGTAERRSYLAKAIDLLAAVNVEPKERLIQRIINYDRDLLFLRNLDTNHRGGLPFDRVVDQMRELERVLWYGASAEREPRPHFQQPLPMAKRIVHEYTFGQTLPGSLVFTISTPRLELGTQAFQLSLLPQDAEEATQLESSIRQLNLPFARRMSERIARGLMFTKRAVQQHNYTLLLEEYDRGFNANMCIALVGVAADGDANVEIEFAWSPTLSPAPDVADLAPVRVTRESCNNLTYVAEQLRETKLEPVTVTGNVPGLTASDNPQRSGSRRAVILRGTNPRTGRVARFVVELAKEDYDKAIEAHKRWQPVQVTGIPARSGDGWKLFDATDFRVLTYES